jgi:hypothetical protein
MALDKPLLNHQLHEAYTDAWYRFITVLFNSGAGSATAASPVTQPVSVAIHEAAIVFADQVSDAVDSYIKSQDIIIPRGIKVGVNANSTALASSPSLSDTGAAISEAILSADGAAISAAILAAADISNKINSAEYLGSSIEDSPKAKIS